MQLELFNLHTVQCGFVAVTWNQDFDGDGVTLTLMLIYWLVAMDFVFLDMLFPNVILTERHRGGLLPLKPR